MAKKIGIILIAFLTYYFASEHFEKIMLFIDRAFHYKLFSYFITYVIIGFPIFIGTYLVNDDRRILRNMGLSKNIFHAIIIASIFSFPMFVGGAVFNKVSDHISIPDLLAKTLFEIGRAHV